jgi:hypothetical protein
MYVVSYSLLCKNKPLSEFALVNSVFEGLRLHLYLYLYLSLYACLFLCFVCFCVLM